MIVKTVSGRHINPPYFLFLEEELEENFQGLKESFTSLYDRVIIAYSYKANYLPYMCRMLHRLGAYAEVVSRLEYDLACRVIDDTSKIIFNGPVKNYSDLEIALLNRSLVNLDSFYEIEHLETFFKKYPRKESSIGIRVNFAMTDKNIPFETSRFGFCVENGDLRKALKKIHDIPNVRISCLHAHLSTKSKDPSVFREITAKLCEIARRDLKNKITYIDIGGNLGRAPKEMSPLKFSPFKKYAQTIVGELKSHIDSQFKPYLVIEPGISLVGQAFNFVCTVVEVKKIRKKKFVVLNGSVHNIKPTMHPFNLPVTILNKNGKVKKGKKSEYEAVGYTCMETDVLLRDFRGPAVEAGDFFVFGNTGAYTLVLNPPFIQPPPPIIAKKNNKYRVVRRAQGFKDFFSSYVL
jgi:diaminopimelate decarboxylase